MKIVDGILTADLDMYIESHEGMIDIDYPDMLRVSLSKKELVNFLSASQVLKKMGAYSVNFWDKRGEFFVSTTYEDYEEASDQWWTVDVVQLKVTAAGLLSWNGYVKHTGIRWYTDTIDLGDPRK